MTTPTKNITFYERFKNDILSNKKTITIREKSDANYNIGDIVKVSTYKDNIYFCDIEIISVKPIQKSQLNETHAIQENMTIQELNEVISNIYPNLNDLFLIEFKLE